MLAIAHSGDTIDLSVLTCSQISLADNDLYTTLDDNAFDGAGQTISGPGQNYRVLTYIGSGTLAISGLSLEGGQYDGAGGCAYSAGSVSLQRVTISGCQGSLNGGGIYAAARLDAEDSIVRGNSVSAHGGDAQGGGVYAGADLRLVHSTVSNNNALASGDLAGRGGGVFVRGQISFNHQPFQETPRRSEAAYIFRERYKFSRRRSAKRRYPATAQKLSEESSQEVGYRHIRAEQQYRSIQSSDFVQATSSTEAFCGHTAGVCSLGGSLPNDLPGVLSSIIANTSIWR